MEIASSAVEPTASKEERDFEPRYCDNISDNALEGCKLRNLVNLTKKGANLSWASMKTPM